MKAITSILLFAALGSVAAPPALGAPSARRAIIEGNALVAKGDWAAARDRYASAIEADAASPEAWFNRACAEQSAGAEEEAQKSFREAERLARDPALAGAAAYNLGALAYARAQSKLEQDPNAALAELRDSASMFRRALERNPADMDAARNIEVVNRAIRALEELLEQMEKDRQQRQELADQLQEMAEQQQQEAEQTGQQPSPSEQMQQREDQQELSEQTEQARQQAQEAAQRNREDQAAQEAAQAIQQAREAQQEAEQALEEGKPQEAAEKQQEAAERLQEAAQRLGQTAEKQEGEGGKSEAEPGEKGEQQQAEAPSDADDAKDGQGDAQPPDPSERMVEALLNKEQRQREKDQQAKKGRLRMVPVERDW